MNVENVFWRIDALRPRPLNRIEADAGFLGDLGRDALRFVPAPVRPLAFNRDQWGGLNRARFDQFDIAPPRRDAPISITLPPVTSAADAVAASSALLDAVAAGEVTPGEAGPVMALLVSHKGIVEAGDLERRIAALEEKGTKR